MSNFSLMHAQGCQTGRKVWMSRITLWEDVTADSHAVSVCITLSLHLSLHAGGTMGELAREKQ